MSLKINTNAISNISPSTLNFVKKAEGLLIKFPNLSTTHEKQLRLIVKWAIDRGEVSEHSQKLLLKIEKAAPTSFKTPSGTRKFIKAFVIDFLRPYITGKKVPEKNREPLLKALFRALKEKGMNALPDQEVKEYALQIYLEQSFSGLYGFHKIKQVSRKEILMDSKEMLPLFDALPEAIDTDFLGMDIKVIPLLEKAIKRVNKERADSFPIDEEETNYRQKILGQLPKGDTFLNLDDEDRKKLATLKKRSKPVDQKRAPDISNNKTALRAKAALNSSVSLPFKLVEDRINNYLEQLVLLLENIDFKKLEKHPDFLEEHETLRLELELIFYTCQTLKNEKKTEQSPEFIEQIKKLDPCKTKLDNLILKLRK